jgi:dTDP-4-amino-4,6-dideoxygalactose transaminase
MDVMNPCEYGSLWMDREEADAVSDAVLKGDLFRHRGCISSCDLAEEWIAKETEARGAVVLSNGTAAIRAMLHAAGVRRGDAVLVNAFTFHATASAVYALGASPIPVDLDLRTNVDLAHVIRLLPRRPAAVIAVHWPGRCFHLGPLREICDAQGLILLEDAAQAFGARNGEAVAGRQGLAGAFSFQQGKLVTCGEGGCVISNDPDFLARVRAYSDHGMFRNADGTPVPGRMVSAPGDNLRMTGLQAALLLAQLKKLGRLRHRLADTKCRLSEMLALRGVSEWNPIPESDIGQVLTLRFQNPDLPEKARAILAQEGVLMKPIWNRPFPKFFAHHSAMEQGPIPMAEEISKSVRAIPLPPTLTVAQCQAIATATAGLAGMLSP